MGNKNIWIDPTEENITHYNEEFAELLKKANNLISYIEEITEHIDKLDYIGKDFEGDFLIPIHYMFEFADNCDAFKEVIKMFRSNLFGAGIDWTEAQRQLVEFFPDDNPDREQIRSKKPEERPFTQKIM